MTRSMPALKQNFFGKYELYSLVSVRRGSS